MIVQLMTYVLRLFFAKSAFSKILINDELIEVHCLNDKILTL